MTKADATLAVIENFILHVTHVGDESELDYRKEIAFTPEELYKMATDYINKDHVDGRDNEENNKLL